MMLLLLLLLLLLIAAIHLTDLSLGQNPERIAVAA